MYFALTEVIIMATQNPFIEMTFWGPADYYIKVYGAKQGN